MHHPRVQFHWFLEGEPRETKGEMFISELASTHKRGNQSEQKPGAHLKVISQLINGNSVLPCQILLDTCQESLREVES